MINERIGEHKHQSKVDQAKIYPYEKTYEHCVDNAGQICLDVSRYPVFDSYRHIFDLEKSK